MKTVAWGVVRVLALLAVAGLPALGAAEGQKAAQCALPAGAPYPAVEISNGAVHALVYLPDAERGYYRGSRFDWSGQVGCLEFKGHKYFDMWFPHYDPLLHDSILGPVESFYGADNLPQHFAEAKPGESFVKIGVGLLRRTTAEPYNAFKYYPPVDTGVWSTHPYNSGVSFRQKLKTGFGIAYTYKKNLHLAKHSPVLILDHALKNEGREPMEILVFNHDFFVLDQATTGPGLEARFPFTPVADRPLTTGARIEGQRIVFDREFKTGESVYTLLNGYKADPSHFDFTVEDTRTGVGVQQTASLPLDRLVFWSNARTICPEGYVRIRIEPGKTAHWSIRYRFFAK